MPRKTTSQLILEIYSMLLQGNKAERFNDLWRKIDAIQGDVEEEKRRRERLERYLGVEYYEDRGYKKK